jgi:hypothetical protein
MMKIEKISEPNHPENIKRGGAPVLDFWAVSRDGKLLRKFYFERDAVDFFENYEQNHSCMTCGKFSEEKFSTLGECAACNDRRSREYFERYSAARANQKQHRIFEVGIYEQNCQTSCGNGYHRFFRHTCGHSHTTVSGAARCLRRLSKYWADGTHNEWAHFGTIAGLKTCGHPEELTIVEQEKLDMKSY